jgi:hypothetical protein
MVKLMANFRCTLEFPIVGVRFRPIARMLYR